MKFDKVCRSCMKFLVMEKGTQINDEFSVGEMKSSIKIFEGLRNMKINVTPGDKKPQKICSSCLENLKQSMSFRNLCIQTETMLDEFCGAAVEKDVLADDDDSSGDIEDKHRLKFEPEFVSVKQKKRKRSTKAAFPHEETGSSIARFHEEREYNREPLPDNTLIESILATIPTDVGKIFIELQEMRSMLKNVQDSLGGIGGIGDLELDYGEYKLHNPGEENVIKIFPIKDYETMVEVEGRLMSDPDYATKLIESFTRICGRSGKLGGRGRHCCYFLIDKFLDRKLMLDFSWAGGSRTGEKKSLRDFKNIINVFHLIVQNIDKNFSENHLKHFFTNVIKNAKTRAVLGAHSRSSVPKSRKNLEGNAKSEPDEDDSNYFADEDHLMEDEGGVLE
ncbi:hypothetical protein DMENIID0001_040860 [Sergentomyia squamirostris]